MFYDEALHIENYSFPFKQMYESSIDVFKFQLECNSKYRDDY